MGELFLQTGQVLPTHRKHITHYLYAQNSVFHLQTVRLTRQAANTFPTQGHVVSLPPPILLEGQLFPCGPNTCSVHHLPCDPTGKQNSEGKPKGT